MSICIYNLYMVIKYYFLNLCVSAALRETIFISVFLDFTKILIRISEIFTRRRKDAESGLQEPDIMIFTIDYRC